MDEDQACRGRQGNKPGAGNSSVRVRTLTEADASLEHPILSRVDSEPVAGNVSLIVAGSAPGALTDAGSNPNAAWPRYAVAFGFCNPASRCCPAARIFHAPLRTPKSL